MSVGFSPLLEPGRGPRRNYRRRRSRKLAALLLAGALGAALVGAFSGAFTAGASSHHGRLHSAAARAVASLWGVTGALDSAEPPPRSPAGLSLAAPAFALQGLGDAAADVVHPGFRNPPREGLLFNLDTGQVLWQANPYQRAPIASLTKMMTALLAVRSLAPQAPVLVTPQAAAMPGSRVGVLPVGRRVPAEALLYGLLLPSGNDAAVALAQAVAGSQARFVAQMNREAAALGLGCTRYSNVSGYYDQGNFSCAADLAVLAHADLAQPRIARAVAARTVALPFPIKGGRLYLENNNPLLMYGYPGADGVKTGWTEAAGTCLVASAQRHGVRLGVVLLHSPAPGTQAQSLFDDAFGGVYHQRTPPEAPIPGGA